MYPPPVDRSRQVATGRRKTPATGSAGGLFASQLTTGTPPGTAAECPPDLPAASAAATSGTVSALDALLSAQEIDAACDPALQRATVRYASDLLDRLEEVRRDVLAGRMPAERLTELARALREDRQRSQDPGLDAIVEQVELRAEVELAKLGHAP